MQKLKKLHSLVLVVLVVFLAGCEKPAPKMLPPEKALAIAAETPQAKAIVSYHNGALAACLEKKAVRSCDSEWVTCREDAWVVQYLLTPECPVVGDGRLGMNFVMDGFTGKIISHYPEVEYFGNEYFCRDDGDCVGYQAECFNFVAAPFVTGDKSSAPCRCQAGRCILKQ